MLTDEEVVKKFLAGDVSSYAHLVTKYQHALVSLSFSYTKNLHDAEDLAQQAFIKAYEALPSSRLDLPFKPWLFHICINLCKNFIQKKKAIRFSDMESDEEDYDSFAESIPSTELSPDQLMVLEERKELVEQALLSLPEKFQRVLLLRYKEDLSYEDIASLMKVPLATVKTHLRRGKEYIKQKLHTLL